MELIMKKIAFYLLLIIGVSVFTGCVKDSESSNATLKLLKVNNIDLNGFDPEVFSYTLNVPYSIYNLAMEVVTGDSNASYIITAKDSEKNNLVIEGNIVKEISKGENEINIIIRAENGHETTYKIVVVRAMSDVSTLKSLKIMPEEVEVQIEKDVFEYDTNVSNNAENIFVKIVTDSDDSKYKLVAKDKDENFLKVSNDTIYGLKSGNNVVTVTVTAEDNKTKTNYTININKEKSDNAYLNSLSVSEFDINPQFEKSTLNYSLSIGAEVSELDVTPITASVGANYNIVGYDPSGVELTVNNNIVSGFNKGANVIKIIVTSEDESSEISYRIDVTMTASSVATLSNLSFQHFTLTPDFSPDIISYSINIPNEITEAGFSYSTTKSDATVNIGASERKGAAPIVDGNRITNIDTGESQLDFTVTAEDGVTQKTYTVVITRAQSSKAEIETLTVRYGINEVILSKREGEDRYVTSVSHNVSTIAIDVIASEKAIYEIYKNDVKQTPASVELNSGGNTIFIRVVAEDNTTKVYELYVTKSLSSENSIQSLVLKKDGSEISVTNNNGYLATVDSDCSSVDIVLDVSEGATFSILQNSVPVSGNTLFLNVGDNDFVIIVTASDNTQAQYNLTISKNKSSENDLITLLLKDGSNNITVNKNETEYSAHVTTDINVIAMEVSVSSGATFKVYAGSVLLDHNSCNIDVGDNVFTIKVTAEDGSVKDYTLTVNKQAIIDTSIHSLKLVSGGKEFNSVKVSDNEYKIEVDQGVSNGVLNVTVHSESSYSVWKNAEPNGSDLIEFATGDLIQIVVMSSNGGNPQVYTITIMSKS